MTPKIGQSKFFISNRYLNFQQGIKNTLYATQIYSLYSINKDHISENLQIHCTLWSDFPLIEGETMQFHGKSIISVIKPNRTIHFNDMTCLYNLLLWSYRANYLKNSMRWHTVYFVLIQEMMNLSIFLYFPEWKKLKNWRISLFFLNFLRPEWEI